MREQASGGLSSGIAAALPFEFATIRRHRKTHAAFHGLDFEMGKQIGQIRIVQLIINDEADVDGQFGAVLIDCDGLAMAAGAQFAVVDGYGISPRQCPGSGIAGDSRSDNCDAHSQSPSGKFFIQLRPVPC